MAAFPVTRWSLIARLPDQPQQVGPLMALYTDAIADYLAVKLAGERRERIDDVVQEVLLDLLGKADVLAKAQPGQGSRFRYYLMNLAWLSARNALRRLRRRDGAAGSVAEDGDDDLPLVDRLPADTPAPERAAMDRAWAVSVIRDALDDVRRCDEIAADLLSAHLVEGRALRDLAQERGLALATCHRRLAAARHRLHEAIAERLRLVGELGASEDPAAACAVLMQAVAQG
jgi:DNA-directed RNA polymerase specialized sigma24 family protein